MVAVKSSEVEAVMRRADTRASLFLVYGPDAGLVGERARTLAERAVADPADPFQLVRLEGDDVAADPLKLADEANTIGLFGRRAIWIKPTSRNLVPAVAPLIAVPPLDAIVVIEAGDLAKSSPLRSLCERSPAALALPCHGDGARDIGMLVETMLREAGLSIAREAREALVSLLGADRIATRNEIAKLALYAHGQASVTLDDIERCVGDVSSLAADAAVDAAFGGDFTSLDQAVARLALEGLDPGVLVGFALRHAWALARARIAVGQGKGAAAAAEGMRVHFKRKANVERQIRLWALPMLDRAIRDCGDAMAKTRQHPALASPVAMKCLWSITLAARRAAR